MHCLHHSDHSKATSLIILDLFSMQWYTFVLIVAAGVVCYLALYTSVLYRPCTAPIFARMASTKWLRHLVHVLPILMVARWMHSVWLSDLDLKWFHYFGVSLLLWRPLEIMIEWLTRVSPTRPPNSTPATYLESDMVDNIGTEGVDNE